MPTKTLPAEKVSSSPQETVPQLYSDGLRHIGMLTLQGSEGSRCWYDDDMSELPDGAQSDIAGCTGYQVHIEGELAGDLNSYVNLTLPREPGNILLIARHKLLAARLALGATSLMRGGEDPTGALMQALYKRPLGRSGREYAAVVSYAHDALRQLQEVTVALGTSAPVRVLFPLARD